MNFQSYGALSLQLRLPDALASYGKYVEFNGVRFAYGQYAITTPLASSQRIASKTKAGKDNVKRIGCALSYRFVRDAKGWRVFASCEAAQVSVTTSKVLGVMGLDIKADRLAASEIDWFGNWVQSHRIDLHTYGKTTEQAKAFIGDAAAAMVEWASKAGKPIVLQQMGFAKKKAELEATHKALARMLSNFTYNKVISSIKAAAFRSGVQVIDVNQAYTSVVGAVNHTQNMGYRFIRARPWPSPEEV